MTRIFTPAWRAKLSAAAKGRVLSEETRRRMSEARKGKQMGSANPMFGKAPSAETRALLSAAAKRQPPRTAEHKAKLAEYNRTRTHSEETLAKLRAATASNWNNPEYRNRVSASMRETWAKDDGSRRQVVSAAVTKSLRVRLQKGSVGHRHRYGGVNFRSTGEVNAAVMFDRLGWRWQYEPAIIVDADGSMLPDFMVHDAQGVAIYEIGDSGRKLGKLLRLAAATGLRVHGLSDPRVRRRATQHSADRPESGL